ncbi:type I restriction endonuclease subunit R [Alicyclobacillus sp. SO9]|uniref:type I restriction endonuclease subunit R n=1 Tax=Alicyclobacillus sp. SO9 TaxID=2665646 RepID=UPI0018E6EB45|nr:DEAD/DEAH box helicase family protein [Alicyclobacillus sp. SO9]QQE80432.1 type I restriction endonuclease subunit R [Alicyclobacillus sp. SO9]
MTQIHTEKALEEAIEGHLIDYGWTKGDPATFDRQRALFPETFTKFVQETQPDHYQKLVGFFGAKTNEEIVKRLVQVLERDGMLKVIRKGFDIYGVPVKTAFFKPASGLNPETIARYEQNVLTVTRQVHYSVKDKEKSLDMVLSINGLPVMTLELKNQYTGQRVQNAIRQYKEDRDPRELLFQFKKRALVHFAVDPDEVYMTTKLNGKNTFFLPFNRGYNFGAGNPPSDGFRTAYLWEDVWQKDSFLELLQKFLHLQVEEKVKDGKKTTTETMIFPRYHQRDAVLRILTDVLKVGPGHNYLIQHSAGSGKTNTIAWLAHRLSNLHGSDDKSIFDGIIVITDRKVLDRQLQDAIYQFDHVQGVVQQIDKNSKQLKAALENKEAKIIISTLQKFGVISNQVADLSDKNFAIVVDEAHSSQSGKAADAVKEVLAAGSLEEAEHIQREVDARNTDMEDRIVEKVAKDGPQKNLSYFAFTATPKAKTIEMFGRKPSPEESAQPFHLYSMRQAIEEEFILDVLKNYTTYKAFYKLAKAVEDDPTLEEKPAKKAIARFASLHPHNVSQKTEIMVEHFRNVTRNKIGGRAKAIVVTSSRLHALRYKKAFDEYIQRKHYTDVQTLVAFSGTVVDEDISYTEPEINGFGEGELPEKFDTDDYQVLIVANKYQTGFDQPLLHTMYVDKKLSGIQAVQTLSRLNRKTRGKEDTFVLDFANEADDIRKAFQDYYEVTNLGEATDLNLIFDLKSRLEQVQLIWPDDIEALCEVFYSGKAKNAAALHKYTDPAVERFKALPNDGQEEFRSTLSTFVRVYSFVTQIAPFQSVAMHKFYTYTRLLLRKLPQRGRVTLDLDDEVAMEYYRLQETWNGNIALAKGEQGEVDGITQAGTGTNEKKMAQLSSIISVLNEAFGTDFTEADRLFFEQVETDIMEDEDIVQAARSNTMENFSYAFDDVFLSKVIDRIGTNDEIFAKIMNEQKFQDAVKSWIMKSVYTKLHNPDQPSQ